MSLLPEYDRAPLLAKLSKAFPGLRWELVGQSDLKCVRTTSGQVFPTLYVSYYGKLGHLAVLDFDRGPPRRNVKEDRLIPLLRKQIRERLERAQQLQKTLEEALNA